MLQLSSKWSYFKNHDGFREAPLLALGRLIYWRMRCLLAMPQTIRLPKWGCRLTLPAQWRGIAKLIFVFREKYEPELGHLEKFLSRGDTFVDVGACLGIYTSVAGKLVGASGQVIAFEPATRAFSELRRNIEANRLRNVIALQIALSDHNASARLFHHPDPSRNSLGEAESIAGKFEEVTTQTLDAALARTGARHVDVIKMDVEGAEELVLRGAEHILAKDRPVIIFEVNPEASCQMGLAKDGAWRLLKQFGYRFYRMQPSGPPSELEQLPPGGNVLAIHSHNLVPTYQGMMP